VVARRFASLSSFRRWPLWARGSAAVDEPAAGALVELRERWGLASFRYQWLCACAVWPELRFEITTYLGAELAKVAERDPPDEQELLALARLSWFRQGWMPEDLRLALMRDLEPHYRLIVRQALQQLLYALLDARRADSDGIFALDEVLPRPRRGWHTDLRDVLGTARPAAPEADAIFVRFMTGGLPGAGLASKLARRLGSRWGGRLERLLGSVPRPWEIELDRALARRLGSRVQTWLDRPTLVGALLALAVAPSVVATADSWLQPFYKETVVAEDITGPEMVELRGGSFLMGSPEGKAFSESPQHWVEVSGFAIGRYEVTFDEWDACVADGGCNGYRPSDRGWGRGQHPVINVSWEDAQAYVGWLSEKTGATYRLPSEAEWEYAARAGTTTPFWWGEQATPDMANFDRAVGRTTEVGTYPPNPWGLHDVAGNVWEWVEDCWNESYRGAPVDDSPWLLGDCSRRVVRGGSWYYPPVYLRSAFRFRFEPDDRNLNLGFRVSRTLVTP
jgi:formylglycine-generating enzyme required for sulfatase activity